jgi:hypothetical protein
VLTKSGGSSGPRRKRDPHTPAEWQEAVDGAAAARAIADCKMYGLLEGGPEINLARCDSILERGRRRGVFPSRPVTELAVAFIRAVNDEVRQR